MSVQGKLSYIRLSQSATQHRVTFRAKRCPLYFDANCQRDKLSDKLARQLSGRRNETAPRVPLINRTRIKVGKRRAKDRPRDGWTDTGPLM